MGGERTMGRRRWRTPLVALGVAVLGLVAAGCGDDEGEEAAAEIDGPIVIGGIFDRSGATGDVGTPYADGSEDYVDWRNEEMGGAGGAEVVLEGNDYQYDVAIAEQLYSQYIGDGAVAILGWGTGDTEALRGQVAADEVPFFSGSYSEELIDPSESPYNFSVVATYSDQIRIALGEIAEESPGAGVAVFHHDSPFGTSPVADGEAYIDEAGLDISSYESYAMPGGATDYVSELTQATGDGADYVIVQNVASPAAQLVQNIDEQGLDLPVFCLNWCAGEILPELAGDSAEGVRGVVPWMPPSADAPGLDTPREWLAEQDEDLDERGVHYVQGWWQTHVMVEAIERVVEAGDEVTGPNIRAAMYEAPFDVEGVAPEISFSEDSHRGTSGAPIFEVQDGTWVQVTDFIEP